MGSMKTLAFITIAVTIGFAGISLAQTCGIFENEANTPGSYTWNVLVNAIIENNPNPDHWEHKEADYYINTSSCPAGAEAAINAAAGTWNGASWGGDNDFTFNYEGSTLRYADKKDNHNVIAFQNITSAGSNTVARTYIRSRGLWPIPRDRIKEIDTIFDVDKYWATAPTANHYDIESVALHEFGHWLELEHPEGCDEYESAVMYYNLPTNTIKRVLHWIDKWGKWYIYSSGQVPMAPASTPIERIPPPLQSAADVLHTRLLHNYPDPFNPETWIPYELAHDANVSIDIYNSKGGLVRTIVVGDMRRGSYIEKPKAVYWDGKDDNGASVASGVYFYTLRADNFSQTRCLVILK